LCILLFGVLTGLLSGLYPALSFSRYRPIEMLQSKITIARNKSGLRKGFIIIQFLITIVLISFQLFIVKQVSFMKNHNLGFNVEDLLSVPLYTNDENKRLAFARLLTESIKMKQLLTTLRGSLCLRTFRGTSSRTGLQQFRKEHLRKIRKKWL